MTFLFSDIESSTLLLQQLGAERYAAALDEHRALLQAAFDRHAGYVVDCEGDAFFVAFQSATDAVAAAGEAQQALAAHAWPEGHELRVRIGVHTGEPLLAPPKYVGIDIHRAARIMAAGHGGQVVLSQTSRDLLDERFEVRDLGEHRLKDLSAPQRLYQLLLEGLPSEFPALKSLYRTNLPVPATPFLGREKELAEVVAHLRAADSRLVTLTGPGGTGKTRLALQAAAEVSDDHPDGVFWVALAPLRDPHLALSQVAQALEVKEAPGQGIAATLTARLAGKRLLLLLDNAEHLLPGIASDLAVLRDGLPTLRLLVTSRERLQVTGEQTYAVPFLEQAEAVELFLARAAEVGTVLEPSTAVAELCARLDNLPLALELAAARTVVFSPEQLIDRLSQRLDLLKGPRDADPRQQTLRATIEWSHDLLANEEKQLFARLSIFTGGCTYEAAEQVCDADPDTLQSLIDKSLVRRRDTDLGPRYWMLETIREYAVEQMEESGDAEVRQLSHATHFLSLAEAAEPKLLKADRDLWFKRLDHEHANLRAAISWLHTTHRSELELQLVSELWRFWYLGGHLREGRRWLEDALASGGEQSVVRRIKAIHGAALLAHRMGDYSRTEVLAEEWLTLARQYEDSEGVATSLLALGLVAAERGEYERAEALDGEGAEIARKMGHREVLMMAMNNLGDTAMLQGNNDQARLLFQESVDLSCELNDEKHIAAGHVNLGTLALRDGRTDEARDLLSKGLERAHSLGDKEILIWCLESFAALAVSERKGEKAATLLAAVEVLREETGHARQASERQNDEQNQIVLSSELGEDRRAATRASAREMTLDDAINYALDRSEKM